MTKNLAAGRGAGRVPGAKEEGALASTLKSISRNEDGSWKM